MASVTVRISSATRSALKALAAKSGLPMQKVLEVAVERYKRQCILDEANRVYEALRKSEKARKEEAVERELWESTLGDGVNE